MNLRIGTIALVNRDQERAAAELRDLLSYGFESCALVFRGAPADFEFERLADTVAGVFADADAVPSALCTYGDPLQPGADGEQSARMWECLVDNAHLFGCDVVAGFTGRVAGKPIAECIPAFRRIFGPLAERAADRNVRIAFENCGCDRNMAHNPDVWKLMFDAVPGDHIGLEWEPCHQILQGLDPIPQLREWAARVFHVHGKDAATMNLWGAMRESLGTDRVPAHRTAGFGDTDWREIIAILAEAGFSGSIDIEGYHDPVYKDDLELIGQVHGLNYLKACRRQVVGSG